MLTPTQIVNSTMSVKVQRALAMIDSKLVDMIGAGPGETFYDLSILVNFDNMNLDDDEQYAVKHILLAAGWSNVHVLKDHVNFYFPDSQ